MSASKSPFDLYRAVWRWHFYAGVLVMPVLMVMALTGGLYLFKAEIDHAVYARMIDVPAASTQAPPSVWIAAASSAGGGRAAVVDVPDRSDQAVRVRVDRADGMKRTVFVDPHTARVTGVTAFGGVMETIKTIHSLSLFGTVMNLVVEIVAGWAIILTLTGFYLWGPRGGEKAAVAVRQPPSTGRPFWRDLHRVTGLYVGGVILFLALTGMPWSAVWGDRFMGVLRETGLGRPPAPAAASPWVHAGPHDTPAGVGWTMENAAMHGHAAPAAPAAALDDVLAAAASSALPRPWTVTIPATPDLAWTVARQTRQAQDARTLYVDGATGQVKADIRWSQFGAGAKAFEWGIAVHQGLQYGQINRLIMLAGCVGVWLLGISGVIMWWRRRPPRLGSDARLGAPPPADARAGRMALLILLPLAVLFPLTGLSLIVVALVDWLVRRRDRSPQAGVGL